MATKTSLWAYLTVLLAAMVGLAMTPLAMAQQTSNPGQTPGQNQSQSGKAITATGCLQQAPSGSGFQLTDAATMKTYDLTPASGSVDLSSDVGHTVTVTGQPAQGSEAGEAGEPGQANPQSNPSNPGSNPAGNPASSQSQHQQLNVTHVKKVSNSCQGGL